MFPSPKKKDLVLSKPSMFAFFGPSMKHASEEVHGRRYLLVAEQLQSASSLPVSEKLRLMKLGFRADSLHGHSTDAVPSTISTTSARNSEASSQGELEGDNADALSVYSDTGVEEPMSDAELVGQEVLLALPPSAPETSCSLGGCIPSACPSLKLSREEKVKQRKEDRRPISDITKRWRRRRY